MARESESLTSTELIDSILQEAISQKASDIHIEPMDQVLRIRFRVDGTLREISTRPIFEYEPILNTLKVMSNIDPMSHMEPKEGHFTSNVAMPGITANKASQRKILSSIWSKEPSVPEEPSATALPNSSTLDVRVSIFPTTKGEAIAMRLLNTSSEERTLDDLGFSPEQLVKVKQLVSRPYGMVLITGPTGSGKTTTIYSILAGLITKERNIITLEDPVERQLVGVRQSEIHADQGYTYAVAMRSILRQDPDIVMVGEIRDPETAEYAIRASLAGRIIFSTIHSNTTIGSIARLVDMEIERGLIAYAVNGVLSQRLVRRVCDKCKEAYDPTPQQLNYFKVQSTGGKKFYRSKGCQACNDTGYVGRTGIFEILEFTDGLRSMIMDRSSMADLQDYAIKNGMKTLHQDGLEKILAGLTTFEEVVQTV